MGGTDSTGIVFETGTGGEVSVISDWDGLDSWGSEESGDACDGECPLCGSFGLCGPRCVWRA